MEFESNNAETARRRFLSNDSLPSFENGICFGMWSCEEAVIEYLQTKIAYVISPGKIYIVKTLENKICTYEMHCKDSMKSLLSKMNFRYQNGVDKQGRLTEEIYKGKQYMDDHRSTLFRAMTFDPTDIGCEKECNKGKFNTYRGMAFTPIENFQVDMERVRPFLDHTLKILAANDVELGNWLIMWLSNIIQHPGSKSGSCCLFKSGQGTGKSIFFDVFGRLLENDLFVVVDTKDQLTGHFNGHLMNKLLVVADEVMFGGEHLASNKIKSMVTSNTILVEKKFMNQVTMRSCERYVFLSNESWPMRVESTDRRIACFEVSTARTNDKVYFSALNNHYNDNENLMHLFHFFYQYRINGNPVPQFIDPPNSELKNDLKAMARCDYESFLLDLINGDNGCEEMQVKDGDFLTCTDFLLRQRQWSEANGKDPRKASSRTLGVVLKRLLSRTCKRVGGNPTHGYVVNANAIRGGIS